MMRSFLIAILIFTSFYHLYSFQWPIKKVELKKSFASSYQGDFLRGVEIEGEGEVVPIEDGEIIFITEGPSFNNPIPCIVENLTIMEHANGYRSIYGNFEKRPGNRDILFQDDVLGELSLGKPLYLSIIDRELVKIVNPLRLLPELQDNLKPIIQEVIVVQDTKKIPLIKGRIFNSGYVTFLASITDYSKTKNDKLNPYHLSVYLNGSALLDREFAALKTVNDQLVLDQVDAPKIKQVLTHDEYFILAEVKLNPGENELEIVVKDFNNNTSIYTYPFKVY